MAQQPQGHLAGGEKVALAAPTLGIGAPLLVVLHRRYTQLDHIKAAMEAEMQERQQELRDLPEEERQKVRSRVCCTFTAHALLCERGSNISAGAHHV